MARAATTSDAFNAVAEPRRRQILDLLAGGEMSVSELTDRLGIVQPLVSKHLKVLREVGLVQVRDAGRQRLYRLDGRPLRPVHEWVQRFERMDAVLADLMEDERYEHDDAQRDGGAAQRHPDPDHP